MNKPQPPAVPEHDLVNVDPYAPLGPNVPRRGNWLSRQLARLSMRLFGWKIEGRVPNLAKFVLVGAPHTSNWDFVLTLLTLFAMGIKIHYVIKDSFLLSPIGLPFRWLGGISVNRSQSQGFVEQMAQRFRSHDKFVLAIMPEGTRSRVREWRSGFYFIAMSAGVPMLPVIFDYGHKTMRLGAAITPTGDYETDLPMVQAAFAGVQGRHPS